MKYLPGYIFYNGDIPGGGTVLAPGTRIEQPLTWNGASWGPGGTITVPSVFSQDGVSSQIEFPDATPGFPTVAHWFIEAANIFQVEFDSATGLRTVLVVQGNTTLWPVKFEAPAVGDPRAGFFGAAPVARQSITGTTTQLQVDSLVASLVALGLVSDDR